MAVKQIEVLKWLKEVFTEDDVPSFKINEANINKLHQLMIIYKDIAHDSSEFKNYMEKKCDQHEDYQSFVSTILKNLEVSPTSLDTEAQIYLNHLGEILTIVNLNSLSAANIILAVNSLEEENSQIELTLQNQKYFADNILQLSKDLSKSLMELDKISLDAKQILENHQEQQIREEKRHNFNKEKMKKYQTDIESLKNKLNEIGFEEEISLSSLSQRVIDLTNLKQQLEAEEKRLECFSLPPDIALAEAKVHALRQELSETMKELAQAYAHIK